MPLPPAGLRARLADAGVVAVSITAMNLATYGFTLIAARLLEPEYFGELTALMGIILVGNVASLGLQATTARRLATRDPSEHSDVVAAARRATWIAAATVSAVALALAPVLREVLALSSWWSMLWVAGALFPLTVFGTEAGVAQGCRRWSRLATLYAAVGIGRLGFGSVAAVVEPRPSIVMLGVLLGTVIPVLAGWSLLRPDLAETQPATGAGSRAVLVETIHGTHALLAFFALTNADAVLARVIFSPHDSGVYAAGLIVTKACLFLPQFVTVVAYPDLAQAVDRRTRRVAALLIAALGAAVVAGVWLLPDVALAFVGGDDYADVQSLLPLFAIEGSMFALVQLLLYDALARRSQVVVLALWTALALAIAIALTTVDRIELLPVVVTAAAAGVAFTAVVPIRPRLSSGGS
jgi:O-antigen/teichoic acid export membrane protein